MLWMSTERMGSAEGIGAAEAGGISPARQRWSQRLASFACGFATLALLPMIGMARDDIQVSLPVLSAVIVASLMFGVALRVHLRVLAARIGSARLMWMMLVALGWATAGIGAANWPHEFLAIQFVVGVIAGAILSFGLPGLPALYGAATVALLTPPLCRVVMGSRMTVEGSWPLVTGAAGVVVLLLAGVAHWLVRTKYEVEVVAAPAKPAKGQATGESLGEELAIPAAA